MTEKTDRLEREKKKKQLKEHSRNNLLNQNNKHLKQSQVPDQSHSDAARGAACRVGIFHDMVACPASLSPVHNLIGFFLSRPPLPIKYKERCLMLILIYAHEYLC